MFLGSRVSLVQETCFPVSSISFLALYNKSKSRSKDILECIYS